MRLALVLLLGCHAAVVVPIVAPAPRPIWPVRVRVMTWAAEGPVQIGELPDAPPAQLPAAWYVEPEVPLADLGDLVAALRSQHIPGLSLRAQPIATWRDGLAALHDLPELHALILDDTPTTGARLAQLGLALERLYLARTDVDDAAVVALAARYPHLQVLVLEDCAVGDVAAAAIGTLADLRAINLVRTAVGDAGGARLANLLRLEVADLGHTGAGAKTIDALRGLPLKELFLDGTQIGLETERLAPLAATIERIDLSELAVKLGDHELGWLTGAAHLSELGLDGAQVHDPFVRAVLALPELSRLRIAEAPITVGVARLIATRPELVEVDVAGTVADDVAAAALLALPHMRVLRLDQTPITDAAFAGPAASGIVELYASHTAIGDAGARVIESLPRLEGLGLGETKVGAPTVAAIARLSELRTLVLSKVVAKAGELVPLGALHKLKRLYLDDTQADDDVITAIVASRDLRVLYLANSQITEASLIAMARLPLLEELTIGDTRIHAIATLAKWPRLRVLSLVGLDVGDQTLPVIARGSALTVLDVSATEIHDPTPLIATPKLHILGLSQTNLSQAGMAAVASLAAKGIEIIR